MLNKLNQITNAQTLQLQHAAAQSAAGQKPAQEEFDSILKRELKFRKRKKKVRKMLLSLDRMAPLS